MAGIRAEVLGDLAVNHVSMWDAAAPGSDGSLAGLKISLKSSFIGRQIRADWYLSVETEPNAVGSRARRCWTEGCGHRTLWRSKLSQRFGASGPRTRLDKVQLGNCVALGIFNDCTCWLSNDAELGVW